MTPRERAAGAFSIRSAHPTNSPATAIGGLRARMSMIGRSLKRSEDRRFITGRGEYVDDIAVPGVLHVAMVRSTYAHARIRSIDATQALQLPGVVAVVTAADLGAANGPHPHPTWFPPHVPLQKAVNPFTRPERIWLLAAEKTRFAGEALAAVVA